MIYGDYLRNKYHHAAVKIADAEGVPCVMEYSKGKNLRNYEIYGNSVQDGTPSPDTPIEIQSVGDLVTDTASKYYGKYDVPVRVCGKNLFDISKSTGFNHISGGLTNVISDGIIALTSSRTSVSAFLTLGTFEPGTYYIKMESDDYSGASPIFVNGINSQLKAIGGNVVQINEKAIVEIIVFPKQNETVHFKNIQITKSDVATDYEPHKGSVTEHIYLNEPLRKVGDYADYIDFKNQKVIRKIYECNASSMLYTIQNASTENGLIRNGYFYTSPAMIRGEALSGFCNVLPVDKSVWNTTKVEAIRFGQNNPVLYVYTKNTFSSKEELLDYLGDAIITYILDTPTEEPISLPTLKTFKGTTIMSVDTSIQPSNIKTKYVKL